MVKIKNWWLLAGIVVVLAIVFNSGLMSLEDLSSNEFFYVWSVKDVITDNNMDNHDVFVGVKATSDLRSGDFYISVEAPTIKGSDIVVKTPKLTDGESNIGVGDVVYDDGEAKFEVVSFTGLNSDGEITDATKITFKGVIKDSGLEYEFVPSAGKAQFGTLSNEQVSYRRKFDTGFKVDFVTQQANLAFYRNLQTSHNDVNLMITNTVNIPVDTSELSPQISVTVTPRLVFEWDNFRVLTGTFRPVTKTVKVVPEVVGPVPDPLPDDGSRDDVEVLTENNNVLFWLIGGFAAFIVLVMLINKR